MLLSSKCWCIYAKINKQSMNLNAEKKGSTTNGKIAYCRWKVILYVFTYGYIVYTYLNVQCLSIVKVTFWVYNVG